MREIQATTVQIKTNDVDTDKWVLVHDGRKVRAFEPPGSRVGTHASHVMLVGTKEELGAEIARLGLAIVEHRRNKKNR